MDGMRHILVRCTIIVQVQPLIPHLQYLFLVAFFDCLTPRLYDKIARSTLIPRARARAQPLVSDPGDGIGNGITR